MRRLLAYDAALVPEGGSVVCRPATALARSYWKDPAGHLFHLVALKQSGLFGEAAAAAVARLLACPLRFSQWCLPAL